MAQDPFPDTGSPTAQTDLMLEYFEDWWTLQTLKGDPAQRPHLVRDAYLSGAAQGALLARTTSVTIREVPPVKPTPIDVIDDLMNFRWTKDGMVRGGDYINLEQARTSFAARAADAARSRRFSSSTSGWIQTVPAPSSTTLQWDEREQVDKTADQPGDKAVFLQGQTFQHRVDAWLVACFGEAIARDPIERNHRFLEEALELAQACDCTRYEALQLVDYVFGRPMGDRAQEVGGVMVTLAALCLAYEGDMLQAGEAELARIWTKVEKIRAKQAAKPKFSPLPEEPDVATCIAQLDTWNGRLETAIDRQAHAQLGQHPNDETPAGRDPMEQLP